MKVGIIGSGGREHALCSALRKGKLVSKIYCIPGNAGTELIATNVELQINNFEQIKKFVISKKLDLVIVGPEKPLVDGLVDFLEESKIKVFGPNKFASQLEGSKIFTKKLCKKYNIPSADFGIFEQLESAQKFIKKSNYPLVVKADGLAAGKGVYICENFEEANNAVNDIFNGKFGKTNQLLIEEFLKGEEMSFFVISDGKEIKTFGTAQDHKRVYEGDRGLNTGGMGAYSPSRLENNELNNKILRKIIYPTLKALSDMGGLYKGFLYAGLIIVNNEPYLIEYNVRMGDPECQTILPRLKTDFFLIIQAVIEERLNEIDIEWYDDKTLSIVLCSKGYPEKYEKNKKLSGLNKIKLKNNEFIFHAGTKNIENHIFSNGGRVLNVVVRSESYKKSRMIVLELLEKINWDYGFYRKDIGYKAIDE
jgi:phosphoribosylamine--glycine ligase